MPTISKKPGRPSTIKAKTVSLAEASVLIGVHRNTLKNWLESKGCPAVERADRNSGKEWQLDMGAIMDWRVAEAVAAVLPAPGQADADLAADGFVDTDEGKRRKVVAEAALSEYELARVQEQVVAVRDVAAIVATEYGEVRAALTALPDALAQQLSAETDARAVRSLLRDEIGAVLTRLSADAGADNA